MNTRNRFVNFVRDYRDLLRSNLFMHSAYALRYLGTRKLAFLSLLHYISVGERNGNFPNPFFSPAYFSEETASRARLVDYLRDMSLWYFRTSTFFDSRWYIQAHAAELASCENPLSHYLAEGFTKGHSPCERLSAAFFRQAISRDRFDRLDFAFEYFSNVSSDVPLNICELETLQTGFVDQITLRTIKYTDKQRKRFLVFVQSGRSYSPVFSNERSFDVLLNYYDDSATENAPADIVTCQKGTKVTAIRKILEEKPELLSPYEAILFLDDDIIISEEQIERLFSIQQEFKLDLIQASLTEDSECFFPIFKQPCAGSGIRPVSAVEIMMPLVSQRALRECGWVFAECVSGWGVDFLLSSEVRRKFGDTIALAADVVCSHLRPTDTSNGEFYKFLARHGLEPTVEAGKIALKYQLNDKMTAMHFLTTVKRADNMPSQASGRVTRVN